METDGGRVADAARAPRHDASERKEGLRVLKRVQAAVVGAGCLGMARHDARLPLRPAAGGLRPASRHRRHGVSLGTTASSAAQNRSGRLHPPRESATNTACDAGMITTRVGHRPPWRRGPGSVRLVQGGEHADRSRSLPPGAVGRSDGSGGDPQRCLGHAPSPPGCGKAGLSSGNERSVSGWGQIDARGLPKPFADTACVRVHDVLPPPGVPLAAQSIPRPSCAPGARWSSVTHRQHMGAAGRRGRRRPLFPPSCSTSTCSASAAFSASEDAGEGGRVALDDVGDVGAPPPAAVVAALWGRVRSPHSRGLEKDMRTVTVNATAGGCGLPLSIYTRYLLAHARLAGDCTPGQLSDWSEAERLAAHVAIWRVLACGALFQTYKYKCVPPAGRRRRRVGSALPFPLPAWVAL
jgi:hypothetical protein